MSRSARSIIVFTLIAIIHFMPFFVKTSDGSDTLKVGLVFQTPIHDQADSLSIQFTQLLQQNSRLIFVEVEPGDSLLVDSFEIDSLKLNALKEQLQGLILCKFSVSDSTNKMIIEALNFDDFSPQELGEVDLDQQNLQDKFNSIIREIEKFFQYPQGSKNPFRIIFIPSDNQTQDSTKLSFQQSLFDSLIKITSSPLFSKIEFKSLEADSLIQQDWTDSTLQEFGELHHAHFIISGKIDTTNPQQDIVYHPYMIIIKQNDSQNSAYSDDKFFYGKTCQIKRFVLPEISIENISNLTDFIKGFFLVQEKEYADAIDFLQRLQSTPAYFFLAESYFYRGLTNEYDPSMARAEWDSSIFYWQKCLSQTDSSWDSVCTYNNLGVVFQLSGEMDSAIVYLSMANSNLTEVNDNKDIIQISHNLGNSYLLSGQWKKALDIFQASVRTMEELRDSLSLAITYENLGHLYQLIFQRNKAIKYYQDALAIREKMQDEAGMANSLIFLGNAYLGTKDFQLAKDYFKQSLALNLKIHHEPQLANVYDNLGQVYQDIGKLDSALYYFQKSYETYDMLDDKDGSVQTMLHEASVYQKQKKSEQAIALYEKAIEVIGDNNSRFLRAQIYDRMGDIYNNQDNLIPAMDYYQLAADLYETAGNFETLSLVLYNMGLIKLKQNDFASGYHLLKKAIALDEKHGFDNLRGEQDFLDQLEGILK